MSIIDFIAVVSFGLTCFTIGYTLGKDVNNTQKLSNNIEDGYENIVANKNAQPSVNLFDLVDDIEENNNSYNTPTTNNKMPTETILPGFEDEEEY